MLGSYQCAVCQIFANGALTLNLPLCCLLRLAASARSEMVSSEWAERRAGRRHRDAAVVLAAEARVGGPAAAARQKVGVNGADV